jgi:hypothetical protein
MHDVEIKCQDCKRFLGYAHGTIVVSLKCKCGEWTQLKRVLSNPKDDLLYKFKKIKEVNRGK